ncbi:MAG TPA: hypothetical protein VKC89_01835 [Patescibacteria group bacterium]|nr:hypothetical protein [Patescibacteria group bacterium]
MTQIEARNGAGGREGTFGKSRKEFKPVVLPVEEFEKNLAIAQNVWNKLGVDPLSYVTNSDGLIAMNEEGRGAELRQSTEHYIKINESLSSVKSNESPFCLLADHIEPQIRAMQEVWSIGHGATIDQVERASDNIRERNTQGLGHQLDKIFQEIPSFMRIVNKIVADKAPVGLSSVVTA